MNKEKWEEAYDEAFMEAETALMVLGDVSPSLWPKGKEAIMKFINEVDKLTDMYNTENKGN
jgi:hypothetical protein